MPEFVPGSAASLQKIQLCRRTIHGEQALHLMDRRWRGPQGQEALRSLQSFHAYAARLPNLPSGLSCATAADIYSTYSCLHAAGKQTEVACDPGGAFVYLKVLEPNVWTQELQAGAAVKDKCPV